MIETTCNLHPDSCRRARILLRAAYDLLTKCKEGPYVLDAMGVLTFYDGTMCDGDCLREDIAIELDIEDDAEPLGNSVSALVE